MMRKLYYSILVLTAVLASCQHEDNLITGDVSTLTFSASIADAVYSRAVQGVDFAAHGIDIAGYHTQGTFAEAFAADPTQVYPNIFNHNPADNQLPVPHVKKNDNNKFVLNTVKWELDPKTYLSYFAWCQGAATTANSGIVDATKDNTTTGYPWIDVENTNDPTKQIDVATARHADEKNHRVISAVNLDFKHILSKLTFVFKCSAGADVTMTKMNVNYAANQVRSKGRYTFNTNPSDSIGHFGELSGYQGGTYSLGTHYTLSGGQEVTVGEMLLIPQSVTKGFLTFDLEYTIASSEGTYKHTKTVDMPATKLLEGTNHIYMIDIYGEQVIVHNAAISGWIPDATPRLPFVPGPMGDTQLLLDGYDKPYQHVDGKWYWLDRSGYNRHCWLNGYTPDLYDETDHSYRLDGNGASKIVVPAFNNVTELTTDVVCEHAVTGISGNDVMQVVNFRTIGATNRKFTVQMSSEGNGAVYFDCDIDQAAQGRLRYDDPGGYDSFKKRTLWTFQKQDDGGKMYIYQNASLVASKDNYPAMQKLGVMDNNEIARGYNGKVFYVKVTSKMNPVKDLVKTYQSCRVKYNIPIDETYLPPVKNGLMFCYDGRHGPKTVGSTKYWIDEIGKNDAQQIGTVNYVGTTGNYYYEVNQNLDVNYMKMIYPVNMTNDFTAEFVLTSAIPLPLEFIPSPSPIYWGPSKEIGVGDGRYLFLHIPYYNNIIKVDSPFKNHYEFGWPDGYGINNKRKIVIRRKYGVQSQFFMSNNLIGSSTNASEDIASVECTIMEFGGSNWGGRFHAVRFYDRALTDAEMLQNYTFDVSTFGLTGK